MKTSIPSLWMRSGAPVSMLERLANADCFHSIELDRRAALWAVKGLDGGTLRTGPKRASSARNPLMTWSGTGDLFDEARVALPETTLGEHVVHDYATISLSLKAHPIAFFRDELASQNVISSAEHWDERYKGKYVRVAGLVLVRQQPGTAKGVIFLTLEDETGIINIVVWPKVFARNRRTIMTAQFLEVRGKIEREGLVIHVVANELIDRSEQLRALGSGEAELPKLETEHREGSWNQGAGIFNDGRAIGRARRAALAKPTRRRLGSLREVPSSLTWSVCLASSCRSRSHHGVRATAQQDRLLCG